MKDDAGSRIDPLLILAWEEALLDGAGPDPAQVAAAADCLGAHLVAVDALWSRGATGDGLVWLMVVQEALRVQGQDLAVIARRGGPLWRSLACLDAGIHLCACVSQAARIAASDEATQGIWSNGVNLRNNSSGGNGSAASPGGASWPGAPTRNVRSSGMHRAGRQVRRRARRKTSQGDINSSSASSQGE